MAERIEIDGTGRNTEDLVRYAINKRKSAEIPYGHVWCVFDKDSFTDKQFNNAIQKSESNDLKAAWSNEAIELWFILHFEYLNAGISREQYITKLDEYFAVFGISGISLSSNCT
jgi:RloB-like protein